MPTAHRGKDRGRLLWLSLILFLGAAERLIHLLAWAKSPYWSGLFLDELYHHLWAKLVACGQVFPPGVFFRAPLYPYLLGAIYAIFGDGGWAPRILQHTIGLASALPVYWTAQRLLRKRSLAILATALWALMPLQVFFESRLLLDAVFAAMVPWFLWMLHLARQKRTAGVLAATGIVLGVMAVTRPTALVFAPIGVVWLWRWMKGKALWMLVGLFIPILPVFAANVANGDFVLIASQGGINLYIGNNPQSDGASAVVPELGRNWQYRRCAALAKQSLGRKPKPSEISRFFAKKALAFWTNEPTKALALAAKKLVLLLTAPEIGNNGNIYFLMKRSPLAHLLWLGWGVVLPLAFVGFAFGEMEHRWLIVSLAAAYGAVLVAFFVCARFRLPMIPLLVLPASAGVGAVVDAVRSRRFLPPLLCAALLVLAQADPYGWRKSDDALSYFALGNIYFRTGRWDDALREYRRALALDQGARGVHLNMGALYFARGALDSAEAQFVREVDVGGEVCRALSNIGVIRRLRGDFTGAIAAGKTAYERCGEMPDVAFNFVLTLYAAGYYAWADSIVDEALPDLGDDPRFLNVAGAVKLAAGDTAEAERLFRKVVELYTSRPGRSLVQLYDLGAIYSEQAGVGASEGRVFCWACYNLALLYASKGRLEGARELLTRAVLEDAGFAEGFAALGAVLLAQGRIDEAERNLTRARELGLRKPELFFDLAAVCTRRGELEKAKTLLEQALELRPDFKPAKSALDWLEEQTN